MCKLTKELSEFYSQEKYSKKRGKYRYYHPECKECTKKNSSTWQRENPDKHRISRKRYIAKDSARKLIAEQGKRSWARGTRKKWHLKNPDKTKAYAEDRKHKNHNITIQEWEDCKRYFDFQCAYCGVSENEHKLLYDQQLHREHVEHNGENDLSNCIPACKICNSSKHDFDFEWWYTTRSEQYSPERHERILKWLTDDYKKYISDKSHN